MTADFPPITFTVAMGPCLMCRVLVANGLSRKYSRAMTDFATEVGFLCPGCETRYLLDVIGVSLANDGLQPVKRE